ncbi:MAG: hypothetical protein JSV88_16925 [Candidatus Aminicenantes bacterium]|nr:MAG: hypothetical protein JSV88_16925 [Candidatus Aminicenantes bacterium]
MKSKLYGISFLILILMVFLLNAPGCKTSSISNTENLDPAGVLLSYAGCKGEASSTFQKQDGVNQGEAQECITFEYAGNTLNLKHVNAYLNCCPGEITADIRCQGQSIVITEKEAELGCFCDCYYDIDYQLNNIVSGAYTISIKHGNEVKFQCTIDLASNSQGEICD